MKKKIEINADNAEELLLDFTGALYGDDDGILTNEQNEALDRLVKFVKKMDKNPSIKYDLVVSVAYRIGYSEKGMGVTRKRTKSLVNAMETGFNIPTGATYVEIEVRPSIKIEGSNKRLKEKFFETKIFLGDSEITYEEAKKKYGLTENDQLLPIEELSDSRVLHFEEITYNTTL